MADKTSGGLDGAAGKSVSPGAAPSAPAGGAGGLSGPAPTPPPAAEIGKAGGVPAGAPPQVSGAGAANVVNQGSSGAGALAGKGSIPGGGALNAANTAATAKQAVEQPNVGNALRAAGTVNPKAAVASKVYDTAKQGLDAAQPKDVKDQESKSADGKDGLTADAAGMGAGGTSKQSKGSDKDGTVGSGGKAAVVAGGAGAATTAGPIVFLMMLINWLKTFFMAMMQAALSWLASLIAMVMNVVGAVVGFFTAIGSAVSGFVGGAISVTAAAWSSATAFLAGGVAIVMAVTGALAAGDIQRKDAPMVDCAVSTTQLVTAADIANGTADENTKANAQKVYAVLGGMGMSDINIAGILGNWTAESGVDPTGVETVFGESFVIGPRKQSAQAVDFRIRDYNPSYAATYPAIVHAGIGLGQWTNDRNVKLREYANSVSKPWHEIETQLGFMVSKDDGPRVAYIKEMISTPAGSVDEATSNFMVKWEGLSLGVGNLDVRQKAAATWFAQMSTWTKDKALADSILAQAGASVVAGNNAAVSTALADCRGARVGLADNSSLAMAALSYAYPTKDLGRGNDGTPLYQELHRYIFPGDPYFQSCDRGVATAVRWSGTDDTFPPGPVSAQLAYVETSPKWTEVTGWGGDPNNLQPGDVIMRSDSAVGHIELYVGKELTQKVFAGQADPNSVTVSASLNERSPGAGGWYTGSTGLNTYRAFRSTGKEASSKYVSYVPTSSSMGNTNIGAGGSIPVTGGVTMPMKAGTYSIGAWFGKTGSWATYHTGQDFPAPVGPPVYAAAAGTVTAPLPSMTGWAGSSYVTIQHGSSGTTLYAHLQNKQVSPGQTVAAGQLIGYVGMEGRTLGPHLHFEYYPNGVVPNTPYVATDPMVWLRSQGWTG